MKNFSIPVVFSLLIFGFIPSLLTAQNFEGIIYYEIPQMTQQGMDEMPYMIKDSKARMEFGQGQQKGAMILLPEQSKMVIIIEAMKGYMSMNTDEDQHEMDDYSEGDAHKTGETKTIANRQCEVWRIESPESTVEACMAKGLGTFMMPKSPMGNDNAPAWAKELMEGSMPLEVVEIENGNRSLRMRATKIEEKTLSPDLFEIPEGYNDMSGMMQQMQGN